MTIDVMLIYALSFIGIPYKWGGNSPLSGLDCSGFVQEMLRSIGECPKEDLTSQQLYNYLADKNYCEEMRAGSVLFFGKSRQKIIHTAIALNTSQMIEAAGGDEHVNNLEDAITRNAFVRVRMINSRSDFVGALVPNLRKS
jgi:gamma-D-glutamyl-L-lysine dipeptidyl-peptidase